ncbi:MAG: DUF3416 domain-containing protein, partial [Actinobacteria bacterium]|nr:DUF3416 domain-containing protein [Actinomycetota bacterium]
MIGRIVVTDVRPTVNGGAFAVKAISGDVREVSATIFREGHEPVTATLVVRNPLGDVVARTQMRPAADPLDATAPASTNTDPTTAAVAMRAAAKAAGHR